MHLIRNSLHFASWKDRKLVAAALKEVYRAPTAEAAAVALDTFGAGPWGLKYPPIAALWRRAGEQVISFYAFAPDSRKIVYTTNAIESLHMQLRKNHQGAWPHPVRRGCHEADLAAAQCRCQMDRLTPRLEKRHDSVRAVLPLTF